MVYERNQRGGWRNDDYRDQDYGRDYGSGRDYTYSSAREYAAAGQYGDRGGRDRYDGGRDNYGGRDGGYRGRDSYGYQGEGRYGRDTYGSRDQQSRYGRDAYGNRDPYGYGRQRDDDRYGSSYRLGAYGRGRSDYGRGGYSGQPQGYDYEDRGFFDRAGDEVRSWFGDDEAERRREMDRRYDERYGNDGAHDEHYGSWRRQQLSEFDRDYDEYRRENATKFQNEFNSFRTERQTQRSSLGKVNEHMEVVGSDGEHVGTVDKVRGDRIILTKNDVDAGGRHHSIPSRWIQSVDDKVTIRKTATEAKAQWRDEERNQAMFSEQDQSRSQQNRSGTEDDRYSSGFGTDTLGTGSNASGNLNRSFSGTY